MRVTALLTLALSLVSASAFAPSMARPASRWALKSSVAGDIDAEAAAELKKLEKEALERLEAKQKELAAIIAKDSE